MIPYPCHGVRLEILLGLERGEVHARRQGVEVQGLQAVEEDEQTESVQLGLVLGRAQVLQGLGLQAALLVAPQPGLAESWSFTDPTTLALNIRSGITFHDGTPLDAEAVKFNLERNKSDQKSNIKADLGSMASAEITGPMQVTLKLNTRDAALPGILEDASAMLSGAHCACCWRN